MRLRPHAGCARTARRKLSLEHLESREMMAADTMAPLPSDPVDPSDSQTAMAEMVSPASSTAQPVRPRHGTPAAAAVRSLDGTDNNLVNPDWGSTDEQLLRAARAAYADGISAPAGAKWSSPRAISNALAAHSDEETFNDRQLSAFIYIWGQFLDHDIDLTEPPVANPEAMNINVPSGDLYFDPDSTDAAYITLNRSRYDDSSGMGIDNPRQQINQITAWIDGSMVYGSDQATADSLRTFVDGKLRTSGGDLPPTDATGSFIAGDVRANENIELSSMHALFIREHNWWAERIARLNHYLTDEQIYQQARAIVGAEIQIITYKEFLPALLGPHTLSRYAGYDPSVNPSIANEFSTAAFRLGHSLVNDDVEFFGNDGRAIGDEVALRDAFFNPALLQETGIDTILKYAASTLAEELDNQIVDGLRNFLFGQPGEGGLDLASLNIQRGRDHGLADYNTVRQAYGLPRVRSFAEITSDPQLQKTLASVYGSVNRIDLWVGALAEDHVPGGSVGETVRAIVADQFERLRDGDRFWYQRAFSGPQLAQLEQTTLADVITRNTTVSNLQDNVFFMTAEVSGSVFLDVNGNGRLDRGEVGLPGIGIQLVNHEGEIVATSLTGRDGRYRFTQFRETGDYQVRILALSRVLATSPTTKNVLISRGGLIIDDVNFGLRTARSAVTPSGRTHTGAWGADAFVTTLHLPQPRRARR